MNSTPLWLVVLSVVVGIVSGGLGAWFNARRYAAEREGQEEKLVLRVCREFTSSREYQELKDRRIVELAERVVNHHFTQRADSFVDRKEFERSEKALLSAITDLSARIQSLTTAVGAVDGRISAQVANSVAQQLIPLLAQRVMVGGGAPNPDETNGRKS